MCNTLHPSALLPSTIIAGHQETVCNRAHNTNPRACCESRTRLSSPMFFLKCTAAGEMDFLEPAWNRVTGDDMLLKWLLFAYLI